MNNEKNLLLKIQTDLNRKVAGLTYILVGVKIKSATKQTFYGSVPELRRYHSHDTVVL